MFSISSYQNGPDTYLLQVKDSGFPARLREYLGVARQHSAEFQVSPLTHFFLFPFCEKSLICLEGN